MTVTVLSKQLQIADETGLAAFHCKIITQKKIFSSVSVLSLIPHNKKIWKSLFLCGSMLKGFAFYCRLLNQ